MKCLQQKYHKLESDCKEAVRTHTKITMADPTLDFYLMKACEPVIQSACKVKSNDFQYVIIRDDEFLFSLKIWIRNLAFYNV